MKNLFFVLMAISLSALAQQNFDTVKIKDNLYMLKGSGGNTGLLIGKDGTKVE